MLSEAAEIIGIRALYRNEAGFAEPGLLGHLQPSQLAPLTTEPRRFLLIAYKKIRKLLGPLPAVAVKGIHGLLRQRALPPELSCKIVGEGWPSASAAFAAI